MLIPLRFPFSFLAICGLLAGAVPALADDTVSVRVRFGLRDAAETRWDGSASVSGGELLRVRDWHPRPENEVDPAGSWRFSTHQGVNYRWRAYENLPDRAVRVYYWTPGVILDVRGGSGAEIRLETAQGDFAFPVRAVRLGEPLEFLDGAAVVDRVPTVETLTTDAYEDDFAAVLGGTAEDPARAAWVAFSDGANEILTRAYEKGSWGPTETVTEKPGDIHLVKLGRAKDGAVWFVWAHQADGNFDLYGRTLKDGSWSGTERLTEAPQPDAFPSLASAADGSLWLVWQGFRGGQADIFARRHDGQAWGPEQRLSESAANDWEPVVAAGREGEIHVAWDTYDQGNYDIVLRTWDGQAWGAAEPIADTPLYEAHPTLAVDAQNRLWAAWNESGLNWGKDTGFLLPVEGTLLYGSRLMRVAVRDARGWHEPAADINGSLPPHIDRFHNDFPQLAVDGEGRVWLFGRHRTIRQRDMPNETPLHRAAWEIWAATLDGDSWTTPYEFPFSAGRQDVRWGVAADGEGGLFAAWAVDNRDFSEFLYDHADVRAARLPSLARATAPPVLRNRSERTVQFHDLAATEVEDLKRLRTYEIDSGGRAYRIYRGDTHRHTEFSMDGNNDGSLFHAYRYALDAASLDYLLVSEHNHLQGPDQPYINWVLQQAVDVFSVSGRFQPFYGYERSITFPDGHRNILLPKRGTPTLPMLPEERNHEQGAARLYAYLRGNGGIAISHTSATGMGTDWRDNDPEVEPLVEIFQGDRVSAEYEGAPLAAHRERPSTQAGGFRAAGYVWNAWAKGYKLGVQAASDHLSTHYSYACTIAEEFTREGLLDAMKKRHNYGATDNIVLDYRLQAGDREYLQGDEARASGPFRLWVRILGTAPIRQVDVIKNQEFLYTRQKLPQDAEFTFADPGKEPGEDYYYVRVQQSDGNVAWSSPIWVTTSGGGD